MPIRFTNVNKTIDDFNEKTYSTAPISDSVFVLPSYCNSMSTCPLTTICGKLQQKHSKDL